MVELNMEEERALRELIRAVKRGENAAGFICKRLDEELSSLKGTDSHGNPVYSRCHGYERQLQVYESLAAKGMLSKADPSVARGFRDLTTDGRCYFSEKRKATRRRWAPVVVGSLVSALIAGFFTLAGVVLGAWLNGWRP